VLEFADPIALARNFLLQRLDLLAIIRHHRAQRILVAMDLLLIRAARRAARDCQRHQRDAHQDDRVAHPVAALHCVTAK